MTDAVRAALERIAALHPDTDSSEGMNEWGEAECFSKAQQIADAALAWNRAHPAPVERVTLSERRITEIVQSLVSSTERPIGMVAYGEIVARAVIAEYERANGIGTRQPLSDAQIIDLRDDHLPSQGESFDCIAFARAIETKHGITA